MPSNESGDAPSRIVDSLSGRDASYEVHLQNLECSCEEWRNCRSRLPAGDLRRCCRHLVYALAREPEQGPANLAGQTRTVSRFKRLAAKREGFPLCRRILPVAVPIGGGKKADADLFFPLDPVAIPWVTVLIGKTVFRYHPAEDRWANDDVPPKPIRDELELRIHKALSQEQAARKDSVPENAERRAPAPTPSAAISKTGHIDPGEPASDTDAGSGKKPLRFETSAPTETRKRRKRRGWLIFLVILLGGVLYWTDNVTMPPLSNKADGPVISGEQPLPGRPDVAAPDVHPPLEPPLPRDSEVGTSAAGTPPAGDPPEWDLREPLSNASLAADLLELIERDPDRGRYTLSRKVQGGTLLFGADLDLDVVFRIYRGDDGAERRDRWIGHVRHRLRRAADGGSLDAVPAQGR